MKGVSHANQEFQIIEKKAMIIRVSELYKAAWKIRVS